MPALGDFNIKTYADAERVYENWYYNGNRRRRSVDGMPIGNNTTLHKVYKYKEHYSFKKNGDRQPIYFIRLHSTDVVMYMPDGTIALNSGGWYTVTTKDRINRYTNAGVYQHDHVWYVPNPLGERAEFRDGIKVTEEGIPLKAMEDHAQEVAHRLQKELVSSPEDQREAYAGLFS